MPRPLDDIRIEAVDANGAFDNFASVAVRLSLLQPSEGTFELGDDGSYEAIGNLVDPGAQYKVIVNGKTALTGKVEARDAPTDATSGALMRLVVRTKLSRARYASADQVKVKDVSVEEFLVALFAPLGYTKADFIFRGDTARDLITGKRSNGDTPIDLAPMKEEQAKVNPPETIWEAADRHLRRHGLLMWDSPDGKVVIAKPRDEQEPLYHFRLLRGPEGRANNVIRCNRINDYTEVPSALTVAGVGGGKDFGKAKVKATIENTAVQGAGFYAPVRIPNEGAKTQAQAEAQAKREMAMRRRREDAITLETDGWSHWDGETAHLYAPDTVADCVIETSGGAIGAYYVEEVELHRNVRDSDMAALTMVPQGIWVL